MLLGNSADKKIIATFLILLSGTASSGPASANYLGSYLKPPLDRSLLQSKNCDAIGMTLVGGNLYHSQCVDPKSFLATKSGGRIFGIKLSNSFVFGLWDEVDCDTMRSRRMSRYGLSISPDVNLRNWEWNNKWKAYVSKTANDYDFDTWRTMLRQSHIAKYICNQPQ